MFAPLRVFSVLLLAGIIVWACSSPTSSSASNNTDDATVGATDARPLSARDATGKDASSDNSQDGSQADAAPQVLRYFGRPFEITGQRLDGVKPIEIHSLAVSDGNSVYVAYSASAGNENNLGVFVTAFDTSGVRKFAPIRVSVGDGNETDTAIGVKDGTLLIAWSAQSDQLRVRWRTLSTNGVTLGPVHDGKELIYGGSALPASQLNPWVATSPSGFVLGGTWGVEGVNEFQAAGVALSPTGAPASDVWLWGSEPAASQDGVRFAAVGNTLRATWLSSPTSGRTELRSTERSAQVSPPADAGTLHADANTADAAASADGGAPASNPGTLISQALSADTDGEFVVYNDYGRQTRLRVWNGNADLALWQNFGTVVSVARATTTGGVALGVRSSSISPNALHALQFSSAGATLAEESMTIAGQNSQLPYDIKLIPVSQGLYFVAYQEPTSDRGWLSKGVFLRFP